MAEVEAARRAVGAGRLRVVTANNAYERVPFADVAFFADAKWWRWHQDRPAFRNFEGLKCTIYAKGAEVGDAEVHMLRVGEREGVSEDPEKLCTAGNSGHMILNLAVLAAGNPVLLLGYDAQRGPRGEKHYFGEHPDKTEPPYRDMVKGMVQAAPKLAAAGVRVVNVTPRSAINCFERMALDAALESVLRDPGAPALPA